MSVSATGKMMRLTPENLQRFRRWRNLLAQEQILIFGLGGIIGFLLPGLLITALLARGEVLTAWGVAAYLGNALAKSWGSVGLLWGLLIGVLVLVKTQIGFIDMLVRNTAEVLWQVSRVREWARDDIRRVYYPTLIALLVWVGIALNLTAPFWLIVTSANMANFGALATVPALLYLNRKLPKELRMSWPLEIIQIVFMMFCMYFFFSVVVATLHI